MSLYAALQTTRSEEDVKDAYIKALGLKGFTKGLIDIRTKEIWFEAKDTSKNSSYAMFTQLLHYVQDALAEISAYIGTYFVSFKLATHEDEFISTVKAAIQTGDIIRTQITPDNLRQVFDKWVEMIGRDSLIPLDERNFKGAYYTPLAVVDKAYDKLAETLGADVDVMKATKTCVAAQRFQYDYLNDDIKSPPAPLLQSGELAAGTQESQANKQKAQNPPLQKGGRGDLIDYSLTNKVPEGLRKAIVEDKKILVLINPPYAEAGTGHGGDNKAGVAKTKIAAAMVNYGKASNEIFAQFIARISREIPTATLAMFSTLKYVNSANFEKFREVWNAKYLGSFVVHSKTIDGISGKFHIGFLVWKTNQNVKTLISVLVGRKALRFSDMDAASLERRITAENASSDRRESPLSPEALVVLDAGRSLWQAFFADTDVRSVRDELKLNRADVGWYQIRNALKKRNESGDSAPVDFTPFESAYQILSEKLRPQVYSLGFLR